MIKRYDITNREGIPTAFFADDGAFVLYKDHIDALTLAEDYGSCPRCPNKYSTRRLQGELDEAVKACQLALVSLGIDSCATWTLDQMAFALLYIKLSPNHLGMKI